MAEETLSQLFASMMKWMPFFNSPQNVEETVKAFLELWKKLPETGREDKFKELLGDYILGMKEDDLKRARVNALFWRTNWDNYLQIGKERYGNNGAEESVFKALYENIDAFWFLETLLPIVWEKIVEQVENLGIALPTSPRIVTEIPKIKKPSSKQLMSTNLARIPGGDALLYAINMMNQALMSSDVESAKYEAKKLKTYAENFFGDPKFSAKNLDPSTSDLIFISAQQFQNCLKYCAEKLTENWKYDSVERAHNFGVMFTELAQAIEKYPGTGWREVIQTLRQCGKQLLERTKNKVNVNNASLATAKTPSPVQKVEVPEKPVAQKPKEKSLFDWLVIFKNWLVRKLGLKTSGPKESGAVVPKPGANVEMKQFLADTGSRQSKSGTLQSSLWRGAQVPQGGFGGAASRPDTNQQVVPPAK